MINLSLSYMALPIFQMWVIIKCTFCIHEGDLSLQVYWVEKISALIDYVRENVAFIRKNSFRIEINNLEVIHIRSMGYSILQMKYEVVLVYRGCVQCRNQPC